MTPDELNDLWRAERSDAVAAAIRAAVPPGLSGLDYGCGAEPVGLRLADHFSRLVLADASPDVVATLGDLISTQPSLAARVLDLTVTAAPEPVDCAFASMSFHHVRDIDALLAGLARTIRPDGWLVVVDLDPDGGAFHHGGAIAREHDGFDRHRLAQTIAGHGFTVTDIADAWRGNRCSGGEVITYSLFLIVARRRSVGGGA